MHWCRNNPWFFKTICFIEETKVLTLYSHTNSLLPFWPCKTHYYHILLLISNCLIWTFDTYVLLHLAIQIVNVKLSAQSIKSDNSVHFGWKLPSLYTSASMSNTISYYRLGKNSHSCWLIIYHLWCININLSYSIKIQLKLSGDRNSFLFESLIKWIKVASITHIRCNIWF